jgi:hypothetical protein
MRREVKPDTRHNPSPSLTLGSFMYSFGVSNNGTFALVA